MTVLQNLDKCHLHLQVFNAAIFIVVTAFNQPQFVSSTDGLPRQTNCC